MVIRPGERGQAPSIRRMTRLRSGRSRAPTSRSARRRQRENRSVVEIYISYLRKKIDTLGEPLIHTVRGVGYTIKSAS